MLLEQLKVKNNGNVYSCGIEINFKKFVREFKFTGVLQFSNGTKCWYKDGKFHREDGPAMLFKNKQRQSEYYINGVFQKYGDFPAKKKKKTRQENTLANSIGYPDKYFTGVFEWDGRKEWHKDGNFHREDGPAYIGKDGYKEWWLDGKCIWRSRNNWDLTNATILFKATHQKYPSLELLIFQTFDGIIKTQVLIPGMEEFIKFPKKTSIDYFRADSSKYLPLDYTGTIFHNDNKISKLKNGKFHCETGPAVVRNSSGFSFSEWWLDGNLIASTVSPVEMMNLEVVAKEQHPEYPTVQVWTIKNKDGNLYKKRIVPGMPIIVQAQTNEPKETTQSMSTNTVNSTTNRIELYPDKKEDIKTEVKGFVPQVKSDLRKAGIRIACRKSVSVVRTTLVQLLTSGKSAKETKQISKGIKALFDSEYGKGMIGYLMGQFLPIIKEKFPEKYQPIMEELSTEFRVEGMAVAGEEALNSLMTMFSFAQKGLMDSMSDLLTESSDQEKIRVLNETPVPLVSPTPEETLPITVENEKKEKK